MALVECHECGNEISTEAKVCPQCGAKNKSHKSKGRGWLVFFVLIVLGYVVYTTYEPELNPTIPTCDSSHGRKVFVQTFEDSPYAKKNLLEVIEVTKQKEIKAGSRPEDRVCEVTFRLNNLTKVTYLFSFEESKNGGYIIKGRSK